MNEASEEELGVDLLRSTMLPVVCIEGVEYFIDMWRRQVVEVGNPQNVYRFDL